MPGKARDFFPHIRAAGLDYDKKGTVGNCLLIHTQDDAVETIMHEGGLKRVDPDHKRQRMSNWRHRGIYEESKSAMQNAGMTRYQTLLNDLKETALQSFWTAEIGRCRDPVGAFPVGMDVANTTFGKKSNHDTPMKLLLNPPKSTFEILCETNEYHPMYRKSHNDYYPGEGVNRNYLQPAFNPHKKYGKSTHSYPSGPCAKIILRDALTEPILSANEIQADFKQRTQCQLGKSLTPNNNINCVAPHWRFGKRLSRPLCGVEELLRPGEAPNARRKQLYIWLSHLNELRCFCKKRRVDFNEIISYCLYHDQERTGWITLDLFYEILVHKKIFFNRTMILPLAELLGFVKADNVKYQEILMMFNNDHEMPDIPMLHDDFNSAEHYLTTYQMANLDYLEYDVSQCPTAGVPSVPCDSKKVTDYLESSTSIALNPSVYTNYSLSHIDFWEPRSPEYMKSLFEAVGYEFPDGKFEKLWELGKSLENSNEVCVDTFKHILKEEGIRERNQTVSH